MKKILVSLLLVTLGSALVTEMNARGGSGFGWGFGTGVATGAILSSASRPRYDDVYYVNDNDDYYDDSADLRAENRRLRRQLAE